MEWTDCEKSMPPDGQWVWIYKSKTGINPARWMKSNFELLDGSYVSKTDVQWRPFSCEPLHVIQRKMDKERNVNRKKTGRYVTFARAKFRRICGYHKSLDNKVFVCYTAYDGKGERVDATYMSIDYDLFQMLDQDKQLMLLRKQLLLDMRTQEKKYLHLRDIYREMTRRK